MRRSYIVFALIGGLAACLTSYLLLCAVLWALCQWLSLPFSFLAALAVWTGLGTILLSFRK